MNQETYKWGLNLKKVPVAVQASREPIIRLFSYHDAHPVALTMTLLEKFGPEWFDWEPETLRSEILKTFNATSISEQNWQKLQAVRTLTTTTGFWKEWQIFEKIIQALNNNYPRFDMVQRCTVAQLMAGVDMANTIRKESFGDEIQRYIAACAEEEGVEYLPPPIDFAQKILSDPHYFCRTCGNIDSVSKDGKCDFCSGRFSGERVLNFKPSVEVEDNTVKYLRHDPAKVERKFIELKRKGVTSLDDDKTEDIQAAKLMVAHNYMIKRNKELTEQLEELKGWITH